MCSSSFLHPVWTRGSFSLSLSVSLKATGWQWESVQELSEATFQHDVRSNPVAVRRDFQVPVGGAATGRLADMLAERAVAFLSKPLG